MNTTACGSGLQERCQQASLLNRGEKLELLGEILSLDKENELKELISTTDCPSVFRCAAIDRYIELFYGKEDKSRLSPRQRAVVDFLGSQFAKHEEDEEVRARLYMVLNSFPLDSGSRGPVTQESGATRTKGPSAVRMRGAAAAPTKGAAVPPARAHSAALARRQQAASDPSPRVRWLASVRD